MPFYEGIGLIAEKNAVVLDIGSAYTKVGYAGEPHPRSIIKTPAEIYSTEDEELLYEQMVSFVHTIYFRHLLVNPRDRRVVLVDDILGPTRVKAALAKVLFKHYESLSVLLAPSILMPSLTLGNPTCLIIDAGYQETKVIPVFEGVPVLKAWQASEKSGSRILHKEIAKILSSRSIVETRDGKELKVCDVPDNAELVSILEEEHLAEDVKVRLCFATKMERGRQIQKIRGDASEVTGLSSFLKKAAPSVNYPLKGGDWVLQIDGFTREGVCEVLFEPDDDGRTLASMVLDAILASPVDTRRELAANIVFVGGTSMILGYKARLFEEMAALMSDEGSIYKEKLGPQIGGPADAKYGAENSDLEAKARIEPISSAFKAHAPPTKANFTAWTGAAIFGATDAISTRSFTREMYAKERAVPDWSDLRFNTLFASETGRETG